MGRETKKRRSYVSRAGGFMMAGGAGSLFSLSHPTTLKTLLRTFFIFLFLSLIFCWVLGFVPRYLFSRIWGGHQAPPHRDKKLREGTRTR